MAVWLRVSAGSMLVRVLGLRDHVYRLTGRPRHTKHDNREDDRHHRECTRQPTRHRRRTRALERGTAALRAAEGKPLSQALPILDHARRDLSRGLYLREMFDASGKPTDERKRLLQAIYAAIAAGAVMTFAFAA